MRSAAYDLPGGEGAAQRNKRGTDMKENDRQFVTQPMANGLQPSSRMIKPDGAVLYPASPEEAGSLRDMLGELKAALEKLPPAAEKVGSVCFFASTCSAVHWRHVLSIHRFHSLERQIMKLSAMKTTGDQEKDQKLLSAVMTNERIVDHVRGQMQNILPSLPADSIFGRTIDTLLSLTTEEPSKWTLGEMRKGVSTMGTAIVREQKYLLVAIKRGKATAAATAVTAGGPPRRSGGPRRVSRDREGQAAAPPHPPGGGGGGGGGGDIDLGINGSAGDTPGATDMQAVLDQMQEDVDRETAALLQGEGGGEGEYEAGGGGSGGGSQPKQYSPPAGRLGGSFQPSHGSPGGGGGGGGSGSGRGYQGEYDEDGCKLDDDSDSDEEDGGGGGGGGGGSSAGSGSQRGSQRGSPARQPSARSASERTSARRCEVEGRSKAEAWMKRLDGALQKMLSALDRIKETKKLLLKVKNAAYMLKYEDDLDNHETSLRAARAALMALQDDALLMCEQEMDAAERAAAAGEDGPGGPGSAAVQFGDDREHMQIMQVSIYATELEKNLTEAVTEALCGDLRKYIDKRRKRTLRGLAVAKGRVVGGGGAKPKPVTSSQRVAEAGGKALIGDRRANHHIGFDKQPQRQTKAGKNNFVVIPRRRDGLAVRDNVMRESEKAQTSEYVPGQAALSGLNLVGGGLGGSS
jgi:hypothetical protein